MNILVVDDDPVTLNLLREFLEGHRYRVSLANDADQALRILESKQIPLVLSDIQMEESDGLSLLKQIKRKHTDVVVILMTGFGNMEGAIEAIQKGAFDYISKPFDLNRLLTLIQKAENHIEINGRQTLGSQMVSAPLQTPKTLIGSSAKIVEVYKTLARATLSSSTVLIHGESGTGKELVARAIHENSDRKNKKFVAINCGALSENLLESELFGHVRGAFTGAHQDKKGVFEEAHGGTLFLDEVGDISLGLQVKLLRALQEGEVRPVGSNQTIRVDVRIVGATHRDLAAAVVQGRFREDLYYRLKVIEIEIPPLRERKEDIPELIQVFLAKYSNKLGKPIRSVSPQALQGLQNYTWPGNVRELEHQIERAVALTASSILSIDDFDLGVEQPHAPEVELSQKSNGDSSTPSLETLEREHILRVLREVEYNKSKASDILGIDRATLYRKAQKYGIALKSEA